MSTFSIFITLILIVCFLLILVVMVQNPKGGGLASSFGGGGTQQLGGVKKTTDFLDKSTWTLSAILLGLILLSNMSLFEGTTEGEFLQDEIENISLPEATELPSSPVSSDQE